MLSNWRPSGGRRGIARLFDREYRNDHSISLSSCKLRADLPKIEIPAEGRTWRQRYAQPTTIVTLSLGPGGGEILREGAIPSHEIVVARSGMLVHMNGRPKSKLRNWTFRAIVVLFLALILGFLGWSCWVYVQIENYAGLDQTAPSDAICVLGAAEYDGRPSPVFRARLDHALELYNRGIAPLIITLGGTNRDEYSEGAVGREYLMSLGIPESAIIAETESRSTEEQAHRIVVIARANNLRRLVVVSDGTHLFRIHEICAADGLDVLTSPRTRVSIGGGAAEAERIAHEILSYTAWRLRLAAASALRRS